MAQDTSLADGRKLGEVKFGGQSLWNLFEQIRNPDAVSGTCMGEVASKIAGIYQIYL